MNDSYFGLLPHIRWITNDDGAVLLDTDSGKMFSLNAIGGQMLKLLDEGHGTDRIACTISEQCGVQSEQVANDLAKFLTELEQRRLVSKRQPSR
jgi:hypothetical protein